MKKLYSVTAVYRHSKINAAPKDKQPVICLHKEDVDQIVATTWKYENKEDIMIDVYEANGTSYFLKERWTYETFKRGANK